MPGRPAMAAHSRRGHEPARCWGPRSCLCAGAACPGDGVASSRPRCRALALPGSARASSSPRTRAAEAAKAWAWDTPLRDAREWGRCPRRGRHGRARAGDHGPRRQEPRRGHARARAVEAAPRTSSGLLACSSTRRRGALDRATHSLPRRRGRGLAPCAHAEAEPPGDCAPRSQARTAAGRAAPEQTGPEAAAPEPSGNRAPGLPAPPCPCRRGR